MVRSPKTRLKYDDNNILIPRWGGTIRRRIFQLARAHWIPLTASSGEHARRNLLRRLFMVSATAQGEVSVYVQNEYPGGTHNKLKQGFILRRKS